MFTAPIRDTLLEYIEIERDAALAGFRHAQLLYVMGGMKEPPVAPLILRGDD